jgi:hypothetical protein
MALTYEFKSTETLITLQEIIDHAPVDPASYSEQRRPFVAVREEKIFRRCFGIDFYKTLMTDKVLYSTVAGVDVTVYTNFQEGTPYALGAVVLYKNRLYKAKAVTTTQTPADEGFWTLAPRFVSDDNNYLWERYLKVILAFSISNDSLFYRLVSDTPGGLVQKFDSEKSKPIELTEAARLKREYILDVDDMIATMDFFIRENPEAYPDYKPLTDVCINCTPKSRNYGFNVARIKAPYGV